jgi:hypothetical protein
MFVDFVFYYGAYVRNFEIGVKSVIRHGGRIMDSLVLDDLNLS